MEVRSHPHAPGSFSQWEKPQYQLETRFVLGVQFLKSNPVASPFTD
jgi:hypothetical protein